MKLDIWFEFASTYSYLTVSRAEKALQGTGIEYQWRPFLLGPIFKGRGMTTSPFVLDALKGAYMWRDVERRAKRLNLEFRRPSHFPMNGLKAARIMTAALNESWCGEFARLVFEAQFTAGKDISYEKVLEGALASCGVEPQDWLHKAELPSTKQELRVSTDEARSLGIFGAPSFVVGRELFWGDDRLEDAIAWAKASR